MPKHTRASPNPNPNACHPPTPNLGARPKQVPEAEEIDEFFQTYADIPLARTRTLALTPYPLPRTLDP